MEREMMSKILYISNYIKRSLDDKTRKYGISGGQVRALEIIDEISKSGNVVMHKDIVQALNIKRNSVSNILKTLEEKKLVEIDRKANKDSRVHEIKLTPEGKEICRIFYKLHDDIDKDIASSLQKNEFCDLGIYLDKIILKIKEKS